MSFGTSFLPNAHLTDGVMFRRVWAWLIDALAIAVIAGVLWLLLVAFGLLTLGLGLPLLGLLPVVPLAYHVGFVAAPGSATPGQALLGLTVRRDEDLGPPSLAQAGLFTLGLYVTLAAGVVWLVVALFTARGRALHDIVAGVVVVRKRALTAAPEFGNMHGGSTH